MTAKTDPNLGMKYGWDLGENNWKTGMDANLRKLGAIVQLSVIDRDQTAPPGSPADGDRHIPASGASGAWSGKDGQIAVYDATATAWMFYTPSTGWQARVQAESITVAYDGTAWMQNGVRTTVASLPATAEEGTPGFATDGLKSAENTGNGTGVSIYYSNGQWRVYRDDTAVQA